MHTIYCAGYRNGNDYAVNALADDGHVLAGHLCSDRCYAHHDIGITSTWKHENYNAHFGPGNWKLEWVDNVKTHAGWQAALALNKEIAAKEEAATE